jgi:hypothetical protein
VNVVIATSTLPNKPSSTGLDRTWADNEQQSSIKVSSKSRPVDSIDASQMRVMMRNKCARTSTFVTVVMNVGKQLLLISPQVRATTSSSRTVASTRELRSKDAPANDVPW